MRVTQKKQSAQMAYIEFERRYTSALNDNTREWASRNVELKALETKFPKHYSRYMLTTGIGALKQGSTVFVLIRKRSRTGYSKTITLYTFAWDSADNLCKLNLTYHAGRIMGYNILDWEGYQVFRTDDYAQELVAHLSQAIFGVDNANYLKAEVL
jgi:hypothetical protein